MTVLKWYWEYRVNTKELSGFLNIYFSIKDTLKNDRNNWIIEITSPNLDLFVFDLISFENEEGSNKKIIHNTNV